MRKPPSCQGCPMYQDGDGFVPDELVEGSEVFVLGQNPGAEEEREGKPFVGKTGQAMLNEYFPIANLVRGENVSIGNTLKCRWRKSNNLPIGKTLMDAVAHCTKSHLRFPQSTRLVVAQGALATKVMTQNNDISITDWRGFLLPNENTQSEGARISKVEEEKCQQDGNIEYSV